MPAEVTRRETGRARGNVEEPGCRGDRAGSGTWRLDKGQDQLCAAVNRGNRQNARALASKAQAPFEKTRSVMILPDNVPRFGKALKIVIRSDNISQSQAHRVCPLTPVSISPSLIKGTQIGKETLSF